MSDHAALAELLGADSKSKSSLDLKSIFGIARRFYWIVVVGIFAALAIAFTYLKTTVPIYRATAEMRIEHRPVIITTSGVMADSGVSTDADLLTLEMSFLSRDLFRRVADQLTPAERATLVGAHAGDPVDSHTAAGFVASGSNIALVEGTRLMTVSFDHSNSPLAIKVANLLLQQGIELDTDQRVNAVDSNIKFLQNESEKLEEKLKTAEERLNNYTKKLGTVSIDDNLNIVAEQFRTMHGRYIAARTDRLKLEADYGQITDAKGDPKKLAEIESVQKIPAIAQLLANISAIKQSQATASLRYRKDNPQLQQLKAQLDYVNENLEQEILRAPQLIESAIVMARRTEETLHAERDAQEKEVIEIKEGSVESKVIQRQIDADKLAYETILRRLNEELSQVRAQPVIIQVVELAAWASQVKPKPVIVLLIAVFLGSAIGVGLVFLLLQLDTSIRSVEEAERFLGIPVLAVIPKAPPATEAPNPVPGQTFEGWKTFPVFVDKHSTSAESFRTLNASIQMHEANEKQNFTLVTSSVPGEGKSYVCLNAATAMAISGRRTLLVDADLRKPVVESRLFGVRGGRGLSEYLSGQVSSVEDIVRPSGMVNLDVITAGKSNTDPAEMLSRQRFKAFLDEAAKMYDQIVVDSAPVSVVSDTLAFARFFHVVCVVTRASKTPKGAAKRTLEMLKRAGAIPSGIVINFITKEFQSGYYGYYSYYNQYYGHKESPEPEAEKQKS